MQSGNAQHRAQRPTELGLHVLASCLFSSVSFRLPGQLAIFCAVFLPFPMETQFMRVLCDLS